jgi:hypothetical protein
MIVANLKSAMPRPALGVHAPRGMAAQSVDGYVLYVGRCEKGAAD